MNIFDQTPFWSTKVNFIDDNNVVLGYDLAQDCCEHAYWYISDTPIFKEDGPIDPTPEELEELKFFQFDTTFEPVDILGNPDEGGAIAFRIVSGNREKFVCLVNIYDGYYSHGFELTKDGVKLQSGDL